MSKNRQETIADIVAALRAVAYIQTAESPRDVLEFADRIEAAHKREREAGAEAAQICGEIGEMVGREASCKETVTDCHGLGDAAKMRKALENTAEYAKAAACHTEDAHLLGYLNQIERWAEAALSAPPRNCDRFANANEALEAFAKEKGETLIEFVRWLFAEAKGGAK